MTTRRDFMKAAAITGVGYWAMAGNASKAQELANGRLGLAGFGTGGKGDSDMSSGANHCDVVVICDVDRRRLAQAQEKYPKAKAYTDYRKAFDEMEKSFDVCTISTADHTHTCIGGRALRAKKHCYIQKPLTRTIYEARLLGQLAREAGVCTQMGNQGSGNNGLRRGAAQIKAGVLGVVRTVHVWSNRPIWPQAPDRRMTLEKFSEGVRAERPDQAEALIAQRKEAIERELASLDWENWLGPAPERPFWPGREFYHPFGWRGWWDFGTGALGDMACHTFNQPYSACDLKFPISVQAKSSGHDFDSFPARSEIKFEFPATDARPAIDVYWYDGGARPPQELFAQFGIGEVTVSGALYIGEKGAMYDAGDNGGNWRLIAHDRSPIAALPEDQLTYPANRGGHDGEFYRSIKEGTPEQCYSNFPDYAGPLTETILLGNLAVWAAPVGGESGSLGDWGEKVAWDAKNLAVTNLASLKTPGVADLVKPVYRGDHRLD